MKNFIRDLLLHLAAPRAQQGAFIADAVVLYGDSIMHGGIAQHLRALLPMLTVVDRSLPGDTARNCWRRLPYEARFATIVVLQPGTNDLTSGADPLPYLRRMVRYLHVEGRRVVLTGIAQRADRPVADVNARIRTMAAQEGVGLADWSTVPLQAPDGLHPDESMAWKLARSLCDVVAGDI